MYISKPVRFKENHNIIQKYDQCRLYNLIYHFFTSNLEHSELEEMFLKIDSANGFESIEILKYYGLNSNHRNIFNNYSVSNIIEELDNSTYDFSSLIDLLKSNCLIEDFKQVNETDLMNLVINISQEKNLGNLSKNDIESYYNSLVMHRNPSLQQKFKNDLIKDFKGKCFICGLDEPGLLVASHIIPFSRCKDDFSVAWNKNNGLLLCSLHDKLFETGRYITIKNGKILLKEKFNNERFCRLTNIYDNMTVNMEYLVDRIKYLEKHNEWFDETND